MTKDSNSREIQFQGTLDEAIAFLEKNKDSGFFAEPHVAYINLGQAYIMKGWMHEAKKQFEQAVRLSPKGDEAAQVALESVERTIQ